jgi:aryl-alcohol dehydrogenase-like predicted oxidoreductase
VKSRIALGTAQFGLNYGIANRSGKVSSGLVRGMLDLALSAGVDTLDTAVTYGDAEVLLGRLGVSKFKVITKVPSLRVRSEGIYEAIASEVEASLVRLNIGRLYGLLLHDADDLGPPSGEEVAAALAAIQERGLVEHIGVSIYRPSQLAVALRQLSLGLVQAPLNVFDRRIADSGWLTRLSAAGIEVHLRSVFLQGLLLVPMEQMHDYFLPWRERLKEWSDWVALQGGVALAACLAHALSYEGPSRIVVGCDSIEQLREILRSAAEFSVMAPVALTSVDEGLINPAMWRLG